jgi:glycosyltransferase involved in cell wall biosynthesis
MRAARSGVADAVKFLGNLTQDDVALHLAAADVVVVPSVRDEAGNVDGLPNIVMEALASGTPLVTTLAGGIGAVVTAEDTALVVPERDSAALAAAVQRVIGDSRLGAAIGSAARSLASARFGWMRTAERLEEAYERALVFNSRKR